jgi:hypothetical protein
MSNGQLASAQLAIDNLQLAPFSNEPTQTLHPPTGNEAAYPGL